MFRFVLTAVLSALGHGYLNQLPAPDQVLSHLRAGLPSPEAVAEKLREVLPPAGQVTAAGEVNQIKPLAALPPQTAGIAVLEVPPPSAHAVQVATPYLGSVNWVNGE